MADTEQRRALAGTVPTTEVIRDAVTFPRDRLGEPLDISGDRFDAWLARVRRDAAREAVTEAMGALLYSEGASGLQIDVLTDYRDTHYPEESP